MNIDLENIKDYSVPLSKENIEQFFTDENELTPTNEHKDQIFMLEGDASKFLWDFEHKVLGLQAKPKFYRTITTFDTSGKSIPEIKKYLYNLEIPFSDWVFFAEQPFLGFMVTWKMIIKYCSGIFWDDYQQIWDKTLNWKLEYNHGIFTFGKDLIYKSNEEAEKKLIAIAEMKKRKK
jgi:hypothetical protein